jgi:hypothetical protein
MRVLSIVTLVEGADGLFTVVSTLPVTVGPLRALLLENHAHAEWALYGMVAANLIFNSMLLICGLRIWKLDRSGLRLLVWTLCAEAVYFVAVALLASSPYFWPGPLRKLISDTIAPFTGFANMGLSLQVITAYPLLAAVLIFFSYRWLGIHQGRDELQTKSHNPKRLRTLMRVLSVVTLIEAVGGLFTVASTLPVIVGPLRALVLGNHARWERALYGMAAANLIFVSMLFICGVRIWKLDRRGLRLLAWTLSAEAVYFVTVILVPSLLYTWPGPQREPTRDTFAPFTAFGNMGLTLQAITAYPLLAAVLLFFSYRWLGIQQAHDQSDPND